MRSIQLIFQSCFAASLTTTSPNLAWTAFREDLDNLPSRRLPKKIAKSDVLSESLNSKPISHKLLKQAFYSCPELIQLYTTCKLNDFVDESCIGTSPLHGLVKQVGFMHKTHLRQMIARHPKSMASVLKSTQLRASREQLMMDLSMTPTDFLSADLDDMLHRVYRQELRGFCHYFLGQLTFTKMELTKFLFRNPHLLRYSIAKLQSNVDFLKKDCDIDNFDIQKMIRLQPSILVCSLDNKLKPIISFMRNELHMEDRWKRIITRYPQVLSIPVSTLKAKANFLATGLKLQRDSDYFSLISGFPPVLWLSEDNILKKIHFIQVTFDYEDYEMRDILVTFPQILGLSVDLNLQPKVNYLLHKPSIGAGLTREELKQLITYQPAILAYSLTRRIKPRIQTMQSLDISFSLAPYYIMSLSDKSFLEWINLQTSSWSPAVSI